MVPRYRLDPEIAAVLEPMAATGTNASNLNPVRQLSVFMNAPSRERLGNVITFALVNLFGAPEAGSVTVAEGGTGPPEASPHDVLHPFAPLQELIEGESPRRVTIGAPNGLSHSYGVSYQLTAPEASR